MHRLRSMHKRLSAMWPWRERTQALSHCTIIIHVSVPSLIRLCVAQCALHGPTIILICIVIDLFVRSTSRSPDGRVDVCARDRSKFKLSPIGDTTRKLDTFIRLCPTPCFEYYNSLSYYIAFYFRCGCSLQGCDSTFHVRNSRNIFICGWYISQLHACESGICHTT